MPFRLFQLEFESRQLLAGQDWVGHVVLEGEPFLRSAALSATKLAAAADPMNPRRENSDIAHSPKVFY